MKALAILWFSGIALGIIIPALFWFGLPSLRRRASRDQILVGEGAFDRLPAFPRAVAGTDLRTRGGPR